MKSLLTTALVALCFGMAIGQTGTDYYLLESPALKDMSPEDSVILHNQLDIFHEADHDTVRARALVDITSNLNGIQLILDYCDLTVEWLEKRLEQDLSENEHTYYLAGKRSALTSKAWAYGIKGEIDLGLKYDMLALKLAEELGDSLLVSSCLANIGTHFYNLNELPKSASYFSRAWKYLKGSRKGSLDYSQLNYVSSGLGMVEYKQENYNQSKTYLLKSLEYADSLNDVVKMARTHLFLAKIALGQSEFDEGIGYSKKALENLDVQNDAVFRTQVLTNLSELYYKSGNITLARETAFKALDVGTQIKFIYGMRDAYDLLSKISEKSGDVESAYDYHKKYIVLRDSLKDQIDQKLLLEQEIKYSYEKKAATDSIQSATQIEIGQLEIAKKKRETRLLWASVGLVLLFLIILYQRYQVNMKQRKLLAIERAKLDASNAKLKELDQLKSEFFTNISHEFRTPLTVISGMARQIVKDPTRNAVRGGQMIGKSSASLLTLVEQILELQQLEVGKVNITYQQADIVSYLQNLVQSMEGYSENQHISLEFKSEVDSFITGFDPSKIQSIVVNIIANGIKYNKTDGYVKCEFGTQDGQYQIVIRDNGIGMTDEEKSNAFERFYRADSSATRSTEGAGVGLALVYELIASMGGTIDLKSEPGRGSIFTINMPLVEGDNQRTADAMEATGFGEEISAPEAGAKNPKLQDLLIIEDNEQVRGYLQNLLMDDYNLSFAADGEEGINEATRSVPDIIISDVMMPKKSGFEVVETLKDDMRTSHIPIILLTAKADVGSKLTGLKKGADAYLPKPFNEEELEVILQNFLRQRNRIQERYSKIFLPTTEDHQSEMEDLFIQKVQGALEENLDNSEFNINQLCAHLGIARSAMHNKIKALSGLSTAHYVRKYKVEKAKVLLATSDESASEVSYALGFKSPSYFSTVFSEVTGMSPKQFRESQSSANN